LHLTTNPDSFTPFVITILIYISATWNVVKQQGNNNASLLCFLDSNSGIYYMLIYTGILFTYNIIDSFNFMLLGGVDWEWETCKLLERKKKLDLWGRPTALMLDRCKPLLCLENILKAACAGGTPCACC
jgi:hypothetical protein